MSRTFSKRISALLLKSHVRSSVSGFLNFMSNKLTDERDFEDFLHESGVYTPLDQAVSIIKNRKSDVVLMDSICKAIGTNVPAHFLTDKPALYLSRHIATPNFETLKFIERTQRYPEFTAVIGEDTKGKFVSVNRTKRALGKMPIVKGMNRMHDEIIENYTILDFEQSDGKRFCDITTYYDTNLVELHHSLLQEIYPNIHHSDESTWVDENFRGNLLEQYIALLSLHVTQGIMFEIYYSTDRDFVRTILLPAMKVVTKRFGHKPLICKLPDDDHKIYDESDLIAYPSVIYPFLAKNLLN